MEKTIKTILSFIIVFSFLFSGCGKSPITQSQPTESSKDTPKVNSKNVPKIIKVALTQTEDTNIVKLLREMRAEIKDKTGGTLDMQLYLGSQLGNILDITKGMKMGTIEATFGPPGALQSFEPRFILYYAPSTFSIEEARKFLNSEMIKSINEEFRKKTGIVLLSVYDDGFRWIWTSKKPIRSLEDMRGLKIRTPLEVPTISDRFKAMGADPVSLQWNDIYTAMQTSVVEGFESTAEDVIRSKLTEVSKYVMASNYSYSFSYFFVTEKALNLMTSEEKEIFINAEKNMAEKARAMFETNQNEYKKTLKSSNITVTEFSDPEIKRIKEYAKPIMIKYARRYLTDEELSIFTAE